MVARSALVVAFLLVLSGCVAPISSEGPTTEEPTQSPQCPKSYPDPPDSVTEQNAKTFAETYEATVAHNRICHTDDYGLEPTVASKELNVEMQTDDGFYVFAQQPYHFSDGSGEADGATSAVYFVGDGTAERVSHGDADQISPATFAAENDSANVGYGQEIRVFNFANQTQSLQVSLRYTSSSQNQTALDESYSLAGTTGIRLLEATIRKGNYTITVSSDSGSEATRQFGLAERYPAPVSVFVAPDGDVQIALRTAT